MSPRRLRGLAEYVATTLVRALPGGDAVLATFGDDVRKALDHALGDPALAPIERIAVEVTQDLEKLESRVRNRGAATSAAYDTIDAIHRAAIDFDVLVDCDFDEDALMSRMKKHRPVDWRFASAERKDLWERGVRRFIRALAEEIPALPMVQGRILVRIARRQSELLAMLKNLPTSPGAAACDATPEQT